MNTYYDCVSYPNPLLEPVELHVSPENSANSSVCHRRSSRKENTNSFWKRFRRLSMSTDGTDRKRSTFYVLPRCVAVAGRDLPTGRRCAPLAGGKNGVIFNETEDLMNNNIMWNGV